MAGVTDSCDGFVNHTQGRTDANGMMINRSKGLQVKHCVDGTSKTIMIGEVTGGIGKHPSQGDAYIGHNWMAWNIDDVSEGINGPGSVPGGRDIVEDPFDGDGGNRHIEYYAEAGFSSFHPGGAHFLNVDASARLLGEDTDQRVLEAMASRNGGEVYSESGVSNGRRCGGAVGGPDRPSRE